MRKDTSQNTQTQAPPLLATYFPGYGDPVYGVATEGDSAYWFTAAGAPAYSGRWVEKRRVQWGIVVPDKEA